MRFYRSVRAAFRLIAGPMFRFEAGGQDNVPPEGPGVVVAPHRSWLDPACIGGAFDRPVHFLILERIYRRRWSRWFYRGMGAVPIRQQGSGSLTALRFALRALSEGELVGIFPEGRVISGTMESRWSPGAALLAVRAQAPVIPVRIEGSADAWPHGRKLPRPAPVRVTICPPILPPQGDGREPVEELRATIERFFTSRDELEETA